MNRTCIAGFFLACLPLLVQAQFRAEAKLDTVSIRVGDRVHLRVEITGPSGMQIHRLGLDTLKTVNGIERVSAGEQATESGESGEKWIQEVQITAFDTGRFQLPPIPVELSSGGERTEIYTNDLVLEVRSVLTDSTSFSPIKQIIREPLRIQDFWLPAVFLLLLVVGYLIYRFRKQPKPEVALIPSESIVIPAYERALEKLSALEAADYPALGEFKQYQSELTYILREFLFLQFGYNALEATSEEIEEELPGLGIGEPWATQLTELLKQADLVKFAKGVLPMKTHYSSLDAVRAFVRLYVPEEAS